MTRQSIGSHSWQCPISGDDADKIRRDGMHHCAFEYASFTDLMSSYDRLRKAGVELWVLARSRRDDFDLL
jgi:hypothetical protein